MSLPADECSIGSVGQVLGVSFVHVFNTPGFPMPLPLLGARFWFWFWFWFWFCFLFSFFVFVFCFRFLFLFFVFVFVPSQLLIVFFALFLLLGLVFVSSDPRSRSRHSSPPPVKLCDTILYFRVNSFSLTGKRVPRSRPSSAGPEWCIQHAILAFPRTCRGNTLKRCSSHVIRDIYIYRCHGMV